MTIRYHFINSSNDIITIWHVFVSKHKIHNFIQKYKNNSRNNSINVSLRNLHKEEYFTGTLFDYGNIKSYIGTLQSIGRLNGYSDLSDIMAKTVIGHHNYAGLVGCCRKGTLKYEILNHLLLSNSYAKYFC